MLTRRGNTCFFHTNRHYQVVLLRLLRRGIIFTIRRFTKRRPLNGVLRITRRPHVISTLNARQTIRAMNSGIKRLASRLHYPRNVMTNLQILPNISSVRNSITYLFIQRLSTGLYLCLLRTTLTRHMLLKVGVFSFPRSTINRRGALLLTLRYGVRIINRRRVSIHQGLSSRQLLYIIRGILHRFRVKYQGTKGRLRRELYIQIKR